MNFPKAFLLISSVAVLTSCTYRIEKPDPALQLQGPPDQNHPEKVSYATVYQTVFKPRCQICHGGLAGIDFTDFETVRANLSRIEAEIVAGSMPPSGPLATSSIELVQEWIKDGAPEQI